MVLYCENGWTSLPTRPTSYFIAPDINQKVYVRNADVGTIFKWISEEWSKIEKIEMQGGWRNGTPIAGTKVLSNHTGGLAIDTNWTRHPYRYTAGPKYHDTFTPEQIKQVVNIGKRLASMTGVSRVVRSGYEYRYDRTDGMHYEIYSTPAVVARAAKAIRALNTPTPPPPTPDPPTPPAPEPEPPKPVGEWDDGVLKVGDGGIDVRRLQEFFIKRYYGYPSVKKMIAGDGADGKFGCECDAVVREFQTRVGVKSDGVVGEKTLIHLSRVGWKPTAR